MFLRLSGVAVLLTGLVSVPNVASAQNFRVYTTLYDQHAGQSIPVARSLSLFHGGKTYDFIQEVGEVIVFEPAVRGFTLLNLKQMTATTVMFEELNGQLKVARDTLQDHLKNFPKPNDPAAIKLRNQLEFQIAPRFEEVSDKKGQLTLKSENMTYNVRLAHVETPGTVDAYLQYADWTCRLNYVLYPGPLFPEPRLALNAALRKANAIPTEVELVADVETRIHRRAEHQINMDLDEKDRDLIYQWDQQLKNKRLKKVTFTEYQRALLVSQASRRK
ncbi:MAG: hypothetical protein AB7O26_07800 [Planctomycetaceae bacterium]